MTNNHQNTISISVVDDHRLFREGLIKLIQAVDSSFAVIGEYGNGQELINDLDKKKPPQLVIVDIQMPVMDGYETTKILNEKYPDIGILALSMLNDESTLVKMLKAGVHGFLSKDVEPEELKEAIETIAGKDYYYNEFLAGKLVNVIKKPSRLDKPYDYLNEQELEFIKLACSELTYKAIADIMCLSIKTIDGYRAKVFEKLDVKSRVGMVIYALRHQLVSLENI